MDVKTFASYIKKCQVETTFFFNGSTGDSLVEQLKSLYLKQEFSKFVFENSSKSPVELQEAFKVFVEQSKPNDAFPTWRAGAETLEGIIQTK